MADSPLIALVKLTPKEAVAYLKQREQLTKSYSWQDVWQEEHAHQFTVSRLANLDIMESMRDGILSSVKGDSSRRDWTKNAKELLIQAGWWGKKSLSDPATGEIITTTFDPPRLKLIFDTNTRMAYSAGLWQRIERNKKTHPYIRYITRRDERVRLSHKAWDNVTLPVDDPFWKTHYPPNGWRCRCRAMSISQADYDAGMSPNGERLNKTAPDVQYKDWVNKRTGVVERVPVGIDPGFGYNPGMARADNMLNVTRNKLDGLPAPMRSKALSPTVIGDVQQDFVSSVNTALEAIHQNIRVPVFAAGWDVQIANMVVDIKPSLSDKRPPGYPVGATWKNADGAHLYNEKIVAVGQTCIDFETGKLFPVDPVRGANVLRHEFGHAFDSVFNVSKTPAFVAAYNADVYRVDTLGLAADELAEIKFMAQSGDAGRMELLAEAFALIYGGGAVQHIDIGKLYPNTTEAVKNYIESLK